MAELQIQKRDEIQSKLTQVFRFLQELDQLRNPVQRRIQDQLWTLWFKDLPNHSSIIKGEAPSTGGVSFLDEEDETDPTSTKGDAFLLKVRRPELTEAPEPPESLVPWLEAGWDRPETELKVRSQGH